ncbi:MAG: histidine phosphotransferase family protein [Rhodopila sp.]|nr:histidine phosphotransferase family protein [Rhodopila sp.]
MSGTHGALRMIELASARLYHDINGLMGSLDHALSASANGSRDDPDLQTSALDTGKTLIARLKLRRAAWTPDDQPVPVAQIKALGGGLPDHVTVDVSTLAPGTVFPASAGRIVLNLLLLAADSLPAGGIVMLAGSADDLFIRIAGPAAAWPAGMALCFADEMAARSALMEQRSLQMALTALLARAAGIRLSLLLSPTAETEPAILRLGGA